MNMILDAKFIALGETFEAFFSSMMSQNSHITCFVHFLIDICVIFVT